MNNIFLISEDYIKSNSNLDNNMSGKYLQTAIKLSQDIELQSVIGTKLLEKIQQLVIDGFPENSRYKELLDDYIQPFLLYNVLSEVTIQISFKLSNFGVVRTDDEKDLATDLNNVNLIKKYYGNKADFFKKRLQDWIITHYNDFPELYTYKPLEDMYPNLYSAGSCGLWLGSARGKGPYKDSLRLRYDFPNKKKK